MKIKEAEALEIAKNFALSEYESSEWPLDINNPNIKLSEGGYGTDFFGLSEKYWSVTISTKSNDPNVATMDPDFVIVLVDSETGEAKWFPVM